jgi:hypothetical protein
VLLCLCVLTCFFVVSLRYNNNNYNDIKMETSIVITMINSVATAAITINATTTIITTKATSNNNSSNNKNSNSSSCSSSNNNKNNSNDNFKTNNNNRKSTFQHLDTARTSLKSPLCVPDEDNSSCDQDIPAVLYSSSLNSLNPLGVDITSLPGPTAATVTGEIRIPLSLGGNMGEMGDGEKKVFRFCILKS